jgi:phosphatidylglycerol lysyltransferase
MSVVAGPEHFASRRAMPADALARMEHCAFTYGAASDSYLVTEGDREYFFSSGQRGVVGFQRWLGNMQVGGGLLADAADQEELLRELMAFAKSQRLRLEFFGVGRSDFKLYREHGFQITKFGEEPIVLLDETEWKGQAYEWLRRQEKGGQKSGLTFREIVPEAEGTDYENRIVPELDAISREHLAGTLHRREMTFFVGQFKPLELGRRRLFVAESAGRIECFLVLNPCLAGEMWAIEVFRKRQGATRGVIPFAMLRVMRQLQAEKVRYASLSMMPWVRCNVALKGDSPLLRHVAAVLWKYGNALYDARGMYHFKSRFRPSWREMYVASLPGIGVTSIAAIGLSWGLLRVNPFRVLSHWWRDRFDPNRQSLAEPPARPERLIRKLRTSQRSQGTTVPDNAGSADLGEEI